LLCRAPHRLHPAHAIGLGLQHAAVCICWSLRICCTACLPSCRQRLHPGCYAVHPLLRFLLAAGAIRLEQRQHIDRVCGMASRQKGQVRAECSSSWNAQAVLAGPALYDLLRSSP